MAIIGIAGNSNDAIINNVEPPPDIKVAINANIAKTNKAKHKIVLMIEMIKNVFLLNTIGVSIFVSLFFIKLLHKNLRKNKRFIEGSIPFLSTIEFYPNL